MIRFKQFIAEGKVIDQDEGVVHNPSHAQLEHIIAHSPYSESRMVHHPKHGLFAWSAHKKTHNDMVRHLNRHHGYDMNIDDTTRHFAQKHKDGKGLVSYQSGSENHGKDGATHADHPTLNKTHRAKDLDEYESHNK